MQRTRSHLGEMPRETVFKPRALNGHAAISPDLAIRLESAGIGAAL